jgi:predicted ATP-grasp superfamily ATP-dependent carboligase
MNIGSKKLADKSTSSVIEYTKFDVEEGIAALRELTVATRLRERVNNGLEPTDVHFTIAAQQTTVCHPENIRVNNAVRAMVGHSPDADERQAALKYLYEQLFAPQGY